MENIFTLIFLMIMFLYAFRTIFEYYIHYSKKYKNFHIIKKVSKNANNNKAIVILDVIVEICLFLVLLQFCGVITFACGIALFGNIDTFEWNVKIIELLADANAVALIIWNCSILITSIYYIIVYVKEMKATKTNES